MRSDSPTGPPGHSAVQQHRGHRHGGGATEDAVARAVRTIYRWFDALNGRCMRDPTLERCGFGASDAAKTAQDAALNNMRLPRLQCPKGWHQAPPGPASALLPSQRGILRSSASPRGLHADLTSTYPGPLKYLLTSRLDKKYLENVFSQIRSMCGPNTRPDAVVCQRLRILLMPRLHRRSYPVQSGQWKLSLAPTS